MDTARCPDGCRACVEACPDGDAVTIDQQKEVSGSTWTMFLFCTEWMRGGLQARRRFPSRKRLPACRAGASRSGLFGDGRKLRVAESLGRDLERLLGKVAAAPPGERGRVQPAAKLDVNVLTTVGWDMGRFGIQFVASPRHADGLLVTGPVTKNMRLALEKTWEAVPEPKILIASGACTFQADLISTCRKCTTVLQEFCP